MEILINNWEMILGIATLVIPGLLPAKIASKVGAVLTVVEKVGELAGKARDSKGGFTLEPEFEKQVKDEIFTKASQVLASKTEIFTPEDTKAILTQISKSKGVKKIQFKIKDFIQSI